MKTMIEQFRDFCAGKPADEKYDWGAPLECALAQFCATKGWRPRATGYINRLGNEHPFPRPMYESAVWYEPYTFGALTTRLDRISEGAGI